MDEFAIPDAEGYTLAASAVAGDERDGLLIHQKWDRNEFTCKAITITLNRIPTTFESCLESVDPADLSAIYDGQIAIIVNDKFAHLVPCRGNIGIESVLLVECKLRFGDSLKVAIKLGKVHKFLRPVQMSYILHAKEKVMVKAGFQSNVVNVSAGQSPIDGFAKFTPNDLPPEAPPASKVAGEPMPPPTPQPSASAQDAVRIAEEALAAARQRAAEEWRKMETETQQRRDAMMSGYGVSRLAEMYEEKITALHSEIGTLRAENRQLKESRMYVLSVINFIRASAYSIPIPAGEPNFSIQLEERLGARAAEASEQVGMRSAEQVGYEFSDKRDQHGMQRDLVKQMIDDEVHGF